VLPIAFRNIEVPLGDLLDLRLEINCLAD